MHILHWLVLATLCQIGITAIGVLEFSAIYIRYELHTQWHCSIRYKDLGIVRFYRFR